MASRYGHLQPGLFAGVRRRAPSPELCNEFGIGPQPPYGLACRCIALAGEFRIGVQTHHFLTRGRGVLGRKLGVGVPPSYTSDPLCLELRVSIQPPETLRRTFSLHCFACHYFSTPSSLIEPWVSAIKP
jgi:hypothetical protein